MGTASKYWQWIRLKEGKIAAQEVASAKAFFQQQFGELAEQAELPDEQIQQMLLQLVRAEATSTDHTARNLAESCLRCLISYEIARVCAGLAARLGVRNGATCFTREDLCCFVLDDEIREKASNRALMQSSAQSCSLASKILATFDPQKAGLSLWVSRQVRLHKDLSDFLQQHGVYLITDWAILNDTKPERLRSILSEVCSLTSIEIEQAELLLQGYHAVYLSDRQTLIQQGAIKAKQKCIDPTPEQLTRMGEYLRSQANLYLSTANILKRLQALAKQLRQYRIYSRTGVFPTESLDPPEKNAAIADIPAAEVDEHDETNEFLREYRQQLITCLDQALEQVTRDRVAYFQRKKQEKAQQKAEQLLKALELFHCRGQSMGKIALQIGLEAQYQVTQLMQLKDFRATVRCIMLQHLGDRIREIASVYVDPGRLHHLDAQIEVALEEQVTKIVVEDPRKEAAPGKTDHPLTSLFSRRLCHHLDVRKTVS